MVCSWRARRATGSLNTLNYLSTTNPRLHLLNFCTPLYFRRTPRSTNPILCRKLLESLAVFGVPQVARGIICTHGIFVEGQKSNRQRWMKACREVGEVLRLLVRAMDEEQLEGEDVTR